MLRWAGASVQVELQGTDQRHHLTHRVGVVG